MSPRLPLVGLVLIAIAGAGSIHDYFTVWANRPALYYEFMGYATEAARAIAASDGATAIVNQNQDIYISEEYYRHPTYLYLAPRSADARWFDARWGLPLPNADKQSLFIISPATPTDERVSPFVRGAVGENVLNAAGQYAYTLLRLDPAPEQAQSTMPTPAKEVIVALDSVDLTGLTLTPQDSGTLQVTLFWQVLQPEERELRVFLHLVDGSSSQTGEMVAQHDVMSYPSREWRAGDRFITLHTLDMPAGEQNTRQLVLKMGMYDVVTGERLQPLLDDSVGQQNGQVTVQDGAVVVFLGQPLLR